MKHLFERLSRIARAELNDLSGHAASDRQAKPRPFRTNDRQAVPDPPPSYPREIRQAYAALEIPLGSDRDAIRRGYRDMLRRYHPDLHHGNADRLETATTLSQALKEAHDRLLDWLKSR